MQEFAPRIKANRLSRRALKTEVQKTPNWQGRAAASSLIKKSQSMARERAKIGTGRRLGEGIHFDDRSVSVSARLSHGQAGSGHTISVRSIRHRNRQTRPALRSTCRRPCIKDSEEIPLSIALRATFSSSHSRGPHAQE